MHLSRTTIENFRNFSKLDASLAGNVFVVGENKVEKPPDAVSRTSILPFFLCFQAPGFRIRVQAPSSHLRASALFIG